MTCLLLALLLVALLNAGLLVWIGLSINSNHKETIKKMNEQETALNAALAVVSDGVGQLIALVQQLVANNPDLTEETAALTTLGANIQAAIETAQGGGTPEPIPVPGEPTPAPTGEPVPAEGGGSAGEPTSGGESPVPSDGGSTGGDEASGGNS